MKICVCLRNFSFGELLLFRIRVSTSILADMSFLMFMEILNFPQHCQFRVPAHTGLSCRNVSECCNIARASWNRIRYRLFHIQDKKMEVFAEWWFLKGRAWRLIKVPLVPYFFLFYISSSPPFSLLLLLLLYSSSSFSCPSYPVNSGHFLRPVHFIFLVSSLSSS